MPTTGGVSQGRRGQGKRQPAGLKARAQRSPGLCLRSHSQSVAPGLWPAAQFCLLTLRRVHGRPLNGSVPHYYSEGAGIWEALGPGIGAEADRPRGAPEVEFGAQGSGSSTCKGGFWTLPGSAPCGQTLEPWPFRRRKASPGPAGQGRRQGWGPGADKRPFSSRSSSTPCTSTSRGCTS